MIRLYVVRGDAVRPHVTVGLVVEGLALLGCLVGLLLPAQDVELLDLVMLLVVLVVVVFVTGAHLRVVGGTEAVVGEKLLVRTAVTRLAGELDVQPAVAGSVGLLKLPDVVVGRQVVVGVRGLLLRPGGLPGDGAGAVALLSQTSTHCGDIRVRLGYTGLHCSHRCASILARY